MNAIKECVCQRKKRIVLASIIFLLSCFCFHFQYVVSLLGISLLNQRTEGHNFYINTICETIESLPEEKRPHLETVIQLISKIDTQPGIYCELFDNDLNSLSIRTLTWKDSPFSVTDFNDLLELVASESNGYTQYHFDPIGKRPEQDMNVHWRHIDELSVIVVVGISKHSIDNQYINNIILTTAALILVSSIIIIFSITVLFRKEANNA